MTEPRSNENEISRDRLADLLNEDLAREYQAIIGYVVYSQVLSGAQYMDIAAQLEIHAKQELDHALIISRQIDYLGKMPAVTPKPVCTSQNAEEMHRFDLESENETIRNYRSCTAMRAARRICNGGTDSADPGPGAGPSNRSGDRPWRTGSRSRRRAQRAHPALSRPRTCSASSPSSE